MTYAVLIFSLIVLCAFSYVYFKKDLLSPSFISIAMFLACAILAVLGLNSWNDIKLLDTRIVLIIILGMISFIYGEVLAKYLFKRKVKEEKEKKNKIIKVNKYIYIITVIFIVSTITLLILEIKRICNFYGFHSNSLPKLLAFYRTKIGLFSTDLVKDGVEMHFIVKQMKKACDVLCIIFMYIKIL